MPRIIILSIDTRIRLNTGTCEIRLHLIDQFHHPSISGGHKCLGYCAEIIKTTPTEIYFSRTAKI